MIYLKYLLLSSETEEILCGGKGINVSVVLKNLGMDSVALGFIAGFTGNEIDAPAHSSDSFSVFFSNSNVLSFGKV